MKKFFGLLFMLLGLTGMILTFAPFFAALVVFGVLAAVLFLFVLLFAFGCSLMGL